MNLPQTMKSAVLNKPFHITIEQTPLPDLASDEVLVKIMAVGVCGSDIQYYEHGKIGHYVVDKPIILGHECAGIVVATGSKVKSLEIGDRVAIEPGVTCGSCAACKEGRYNLCPDVEFLATPPYDGAFAQYIKHKESFLFKIPDELSYEEAALIEPFSVGIHAATICELKPGSSVFILGMGPVGLTAVAACQMFGASEIIVADVEDNRLQAALKLGATHTIQVRGLDGVQEVMRLTDGHGVDVAFETAGNDNALQTAVRSVKRGGKCAVIGLPPDESIPLPIHHIVDNEIELRGIFRYANTYEQAINFLLTNLIDFSHLITHKYALEETADALEQARTNKSSSLKVVVYPNE